MSVVANMWTAINIFLSIIGVGCMAYGVYSESVVCLLIGGAVLNIGYASTGIKYIGYMKKNNIEIE